MKTLIYERVEAARRGSNPAVIGRMTSGWLVLGDTQFLRGYCLLLPDPVVPSINDLDITDRTRFLVDMVTIGDALLGVTDTYWINYEILGNSDPALHAHIFPRYRSEAPELVTGPVWQYTPAARNASPFDPQLHRDLMGQLYKVLARGGAIGEKGPLMTG